MKTIEKLEEWIQFQYVHDANGNLNLNATKNNFLNVSYNGSIDIKALASATGITRSVFYNNIHVIERVEKLRKKLSKKFPRLFKSSVKKKIHKKSGNKKVTEDEDSIQKYDQNISKLSTLSRHNNELEKQLHEERAKTAKLEKDIGRLKKEWKMYGPSVKALIELGAFPKPSKSGMGE